MKLQNEAKTSAQQENNQFIRSQFNNQQASIDTLKLTGDVSKVSDNLHSLEQGLAASSQARSQEKSQETSVSLLQHSIGSNKDSLENYQDRVNNDRNSKEVRGQIQSSRVALDQFKDSNVHAINQLKDQTVNAEGRSRNQEETQNLVEESNQNSQTAFYYGSPENAQTKTDEEVKDFPNAETPEGGGGGGGGDGGGGGGGNGGGGNGLPSDTSFTNPFKKKGLDNPKREPMGRKR